MANKLACFILAGGVEHRITDTIPRVLQPICGVPMVGHIIRTAQSLNIDHITVVSNVPEVGDYVSPHAAFVLQGPGFKGSGDALFLAKKRIEEAPGDIVLIYGDRPLIRPSTLRRLVREAEKTGADCAVLTVMKTEPHGHARVMRSENGAVIQTGRDCEISVNDQQIKEVIAGAYFLRKKALLEAFEALKPAGLVQFYVTDITTWMANNRKFLIQQIENPKEVEGVYSFRDLATAESNMQEFIQDELLKNDVRIVDPRSTWIGSDVKIGRQTVLMPNTIIEGPCQIGEYCSIGPFARIRSGSEIGDGVRIGNFVEVVRSRIGDRTRISHLTFVGDADIEPDVMIGAGTITANSDGNAKHKTIIEKDAQIGSGTILVAPVKIGRAATTGAGSVVTRHQDVPSGETVVGVPAKTARRS
jgi:bifunctional UDP-N-acetylglucosamine pyrophosphorylase/glucosamine-1-phosphate N-acetyltransferase